MEKNNYLKKIITATTALTIIAVGYIGAREYTKIYIHDQIVKKLKISISILITQLILIAIAIILSMSQNNYLKIIASSIIIGILLFNAIRFLFITCPGLYVIHKTLRGLKGYVLRNFLCIVWYRGLLSPDILITMITIIILIIFRQILSMDIQILTPWQTLFD